MFHGSSHLDQRFLGDDPTGSAAQDQNAPQAGTPPGTVPPGTLIAAPIVTPAMPSGVAALILKYKPLLTVVAVAALVYYLMNKKKGR